MSRRHVLILVLLLLPGMVAGTVDVSDYADPIDQVSITKEKVNVSDTLVYGTFWYYDKGWKNFSLSGEQPGRWSVGSATTNADLSMAEHVAVYSCSWAEGWDCHGGWQVTTLPDSNESDSNGTITIRARGDNGTEKMELRLDGETVQTWTVSQEYETYRYEPSLTGDPNVRVAFVNDQGSTHDLTVDWLEANGQRFEAEEQQVNTGVYQDDSCGGSYSQQLQCDGYIDFGTVSLSGDTKSGGTNETYAGRDLKLPSSFNGFNANWTLHEEFIGDGDSGAWDDHIFNAGEFTRHQGTHYLYYQGAEGIRDNGDPAFRALGTAMSENGRDYTKYTGNPSVTFYPQPDHQNAWEEGIQVPQLALHNGEDITLYFAGMTAVGQLTVREDIYEVTSTDGKAFTEPERVLDATDSDVWGNNGKNDEIFPLAAYEHNGTWHMFYQTKNMEPTRSIALATGPSKDTFTETTGPVLYGDETSLDGGTYFADGSQIVPLSEERYALFISVRRSDAPNAYEVRTFDPDTPTEVSDPARTYVLDNKNQGIGTIYYDDTSEEWYFFYRDWNENDWTDHDHDDYLKLRTNTLDEDTGGTASFSDRSGTLWRYEEWNVSNPSYSGNPYDVIANVTFTHTGSGETRTTQMFYRGNGTWSFRFTGTRTGEWTFTTESDDEDLNGLDGTVDVDDNPGTEGFLTHEEDRFAVQTGNGETEGYVFNVYMNLDKRPEFPHEFDNPRADAASYCKEAKQNGFEIFFVIIGNNFFDYGSKAHNEHNSENPDRKTFRVLEDMVQGARSNGCRIMFWAWGDESRQWTPIGVGEGINGAADRRLQRYIAARLGPLPGWTMGYGFDLHEYVSKEELRSWQSYLHERFGWQHLLSARATDLRSQDHMNGYAITDQEQGDFYGPAYPSIETLIDKLNTDTDNPHFDEERHTWQRWGLDETQTRRLVWRTVMANGFGGWYGFFNNAPYPDSLQTALRTHRTFWHDHERYKLSMERVNEQTSGYALATEDREAFVVYEENTETIDINLSAAPGEMQVTAVDTTTAYEERSIGTFQPVSHTVELPSQSDWALSITPS